MVIPNISPGVWEKNIILSETNLRRKEVGYSCVTQSIIERHFRMVCRQLRICHPCSKLEIC